jgi:hypothetical protein
MSTKKVIVIGCGVALALFLAAVAVVVLLVAYVAQDPKDMRLAIEAPATIKRGEEFKLVINVINDRPGEAMEIASIDIGEEYLKGFNVLGCEPAYVGSTSVPIDDSRSYEFKHKIPPGATNQFVFKLQARKAGRYFGEVDVCEGMRFLTMIVETQVE